MLCIKSGYDYMVSPFFQQPGCDVRVLKMTSVNMRNITFDDYASLLQKESLKDVTLTDCSDIDPVAIRKAATLRGFHLEETSESGISKRKSSYTLATTACDQ